MNASSIATFWLIALLLIAVPGADWAFVLSAGLRGATPVPAVGGIVLGYAPITAAVAAGVGGLVAGSPVFLTGLTLAGGFYLLWHGAHTFAWPPAPPAGPDPGAPGVSSRAILARGVGVSALNPKGMLVLLALLPQFASPHASWPLAVQLGVLGLVFMLSCGAFYLCLGSFARKILHGRPAAARAVARFSGAAMAVLGVLLVAGRLLT